MPKPSLSHLASGLNSLESSSISTNTGYRHCWLLGTLLKHLFPANCIISSIQCTVVALLDSAWMPVEQSNGHRNTIRKVTIAEGHKRKMARFSLTWEGSVEHCFTISLSSLVKAAIYWPVTMCHYFTHTSIYCAKSFTCLIWLSPHSKATEQCEHFCRTGAP